jgi:hypothetical protein
VPLPKIDSGKTPPMDELFLPTVARTGPAAVN